MTNVEKIISKIERLKPMPAVVSKAFSLLTKGEYSINQVEEIISLDPSITADLLKLANSPYYSFGTKIGTVGRAIVVLGSKTVLDILVTLYTSTFLKKDAPGYSIEGRQMWRHALMVALASEKLAKKLKLKCDVSYTAGLLHDVGKTIMGEFLKDKITQAIELVEKEKIPFIEAERKVMGIDHAEVGALAARHWKFPGELVNAIRYHHEPQKAQEYKELVCLVHVANNLVLSSGVGTGSDGLAYQMDPFALKTLGISSMEVGFVDNIYIDLTEKLKSLKEL